AARPLPDTDRLDAGTNRSRARGPARLRITPRCPPVICERRSVVAPCRPWLIGSFDINILLLETQIKNRRRPPPRYHPLKLEVTFCVRGVQAAVLGVAVTDRWELLFDTVTQSRKHQNLVKNPRVAFVIGWEHERTVQYEGIAEIPTEAELPDVQAYYFDRFPDGPTRQAWPGLVYWRVRPTWIRYSNLNVDPPIIQEWDAAAIAGWLE